ncbi:plastocyanin/azurin family copper-binding protein [Halobacterium sp. NMX12-1]|uniref:Plastocyanin/azurin family copper-binding protein n=1 Tax=Halobacterium sp. NMX12-1 TaxID=3166650 RepID=A0AAU8CAQ3_9EURY
MKRRDFLKIATGSAGGAAAIGVAGARSSSTSAAVQEGEGNNTTSGNGTSGNATTDGGDSGEGEALPGAGTTKTVQVGPNGQTVFDPETVYIQRGATVEWVWGSDGHNVAPDSIPEEATWEGHEPLENSGFEYEYTFDGPTGEYQYVCTPHIGVGMEGTVVVNESGQPPGGEGGGAELDPEEMGVPFQAHFVGIATILMMIVSLVYAFFVLKYGESQHASAPNKE